MNAKLRQGDAAEAFVIDALGAENALCLRGAATGRQEGVGGSDSSFGHAR